MVGSYVEASVSIGNVLYGELILKADVLHTSFPTVAEILFSKFPLDVGWVCPVTAKSLVDL